MAWRQNCWNRNKTRTACYTRFTRIRP